MYATLVSNFVLNVLFSPLLVCVCFFVFHFVFWLICFFLYIFWPVCFLKKERVNRNVEMSWEMLEHFIRKQFSMMNVRATDIKRH